MTLKLVVKSRSDLERIEKKLSVIQMQYMQFQAYTTRKLADEIILETIKNRMAGRGFSRKIIDNTFINNIEIRTKKKVRIFVTCEYFADTGFDVALGREEGTDKVYVKPDEPTFERPNPHMKWITNGKTAYSTGHWRDGMIAFFIIRSTIRDMKVPMQDSYNRAKDDWVRGNFEGDVTILAS